MLTRLVIVSSLFAGALASPMGASGCEGGQSAVGGTHLSKTLKKEGVLADGSLTFAIDGIPLDPETTMDIPIGVDHTWTLSVDLDGVQARPFKGFLVRLDGNGVGVEDALLAISRSEEMVQSALACSAIDGIGGVTHTNNKTKTCVSGSLVLDEAMDGMIFDVTVVIENIQDKSAHFFNSFAVNAVTARDAMMTGDGGLGCAAFEAEAEATGVPTSGQTSGQTMGATASETFEGTMAR
jgi:hypothetical protein